MSPRPAVLPAWGLWLSAPLSSALPFALGWGWSGPLVSGTLAWLYLRGAIAGPRPRVVGSLLVWAVLCSATVITLTQWMPDRAAAVIPNGPAYWQEMQPYVEQGTGPEATPSQFIPQHVLHLTAFVVLAALTGGWGGLVLGSLLLGYMSFYVAQVVHHADHGLVAALVAWHPWSVLRVIAFVIFGVSLARLVLEGIGWRGAAGLRGFVREEQKPLLVASLLWLADLAIKTLLGPVWWRVIQKLSGYSS